MDDTDPKSYSRTFLLAITAAIGAGVIALCFDSIKDRLGVGTPVVVVKLPEKELPPMVPRSPIGLAGTLTMIAHDLKAVDPEIRSQRRYLTLTHLHDNPAVPDATLDAARSALEELAAFLSPLSKSVALVPLDPAKTVYSVDLRRDLGLDPDEAWPLLVKGYPYGLTYADAENAADNVKAGEAEIHKQTGEVDLPCVVRADWFAVAVARAATGGAIKVPADKQVPPALHHLVQNYANEPITLATAAREVGAPEAEVAKLLNSKPAPLEALAPLRADGQVNRGIWESPKVPMSLFQQVCQRLGRGTPTN